MTVPSLFKNSKNNPKSIWFIPVFLLLSVTAYAQGSIGWTESQIRKEYNEKPQNEISVKYDSDGNKNIIVVNHHMTADFKIDSRTGYCTMSGIQFHKDPQQKILKSLIRKFNTHYTTIIPNKKWKNTLRGHEIIVEIRHSDKLNADMLISYLAG